MKKSKLQTKRPEDINAKLAAKKGPISQFIAHNYRHFNAAALLDSAKGYEDHLKAGGKIDINEPEMPTGAVGLIVREEMVWSPPRLVAVSFEELSAEKTMSELAVKLPVGVPVALLDQLLAAVQESPAEPSQ